MGHTIDNMLAIGASYEYSDYSTNSVRQIDSDSYDWYTDSYYSNSHEETGMKTLIQNTLKGVSTFKIGAELKADDNIFVRLGYNYVSPVFKSTGVRDQTIDTEGLHFATTTDYTNWKSTNRITAGGGFAYDKFRVDLAYQYSVTDGDFYPYMNGLTVTQNGTTYSNECSAVKVSNKRHQVLLTLGYTF
jgi:opacity protein-like surface antigen